MKKTLIAFILILASALAMLGSRPTPEYIVWYDNGESAVVRAWELEDALVLFKQTYKHERIYGINQLSYVESRWIWLTEDVRRPTR